MQLFCCLSYKFFKFLQEDYQSFVESIRIIRTL